MYISLFTVAIPMPANSGNSLKLLCISVNHNTFVLFYIIYIYSLFYLQGLLAGVTKNRENVFASIYAINYVKNGISFLLKSWMFYILNFRNINSL